MASWLIRAALRDPNRKGTVEAAIQHPQGALKGRTVETLDAQNTWLAQWEDRWAALRIHGRKKRQVLEMYHEKQSALWSLPLKSFRPFTQGVRTVNDAGLVQIEGSYYTALPAPLYSTVTVRIYGRDIEIFDAQHGVLRHHAKALRKSTFVIPQADRLFNPFRETARVLARVKLISPQTAALGRALFAQLGRPGNQALYALANLPRTYARTDIEAVCARLLDASCVSSAAVREALERRALAPSVAPPTLTQSGPGIRDLLEYQTFFDQPAAQLAPGDTP